MSPQIRAAHLKLLSELPVRTHLQPAPEEDRRGGRGNSGLARPVRVDGVTYASITEAKTKLRIAPATLYTWLREGRAEYADAK